MTFDAIITAGGCGLRFGGKKQYRALNGVPVLLVTAEVFATHPAIDTLIITVPAGDEGTVSQLLRDIPKRFKIVTGGATRQQSVFNGIEASDAEAVLIHDGVRPLVTHALISRIIDGLAANNACIPGIRISDTVKEAHDGTAVRTVPRDNLYIIQTPQGFLRGDIRAAHLRARMEAEAAATDDSALFERYGGRVRIVEGDPDNIKITLPDDLGRAEAIIRWRTEQA